jgi:segregation and condensation protein A
MNAHAAHDDQVNLDQFRGPLDLLLYLVKRDEADVLDIPIARIAEQFRDHLEVLALVDVERAGDFLVLAATLMELKSKMLLPRPAAAGPDGAEDPRRELRTSLEVGTARAGEPLSGGKERAATAAHGPRQTWRKLPLKSGSPPRSRMATHCSAL